MLPSLRWFSHSFLYFHIWIHDCFACWRKHIKREEKKGETLASIQSELARKSQDRQSPGVSYAILGQEAMCWAVKMASHLCSSKGQASLQPSFKPLFSSSRIYCRRELKVNTLALQSASSFLKNFLVSHLLQNFSGQRPQETESPPTSHSLAMAVVALQDREAWEQDC